MQHLVVDDVLDDVARHARVVEDPADDDGVVGGVVVAEAIAGMVAAPGELGSSHEAMEKAMVEVVEKFFEMIVMSASGANVLASAKLAYEACFGGEVMARDIAAVACALGTVDGLAVKLG